MGPVVRFPEKLQVPKSIARPRAKESGAGMGGGGGDKKRPLQGERGGGGASEREDQLKARVGVVGEALTVLGRKRRGDGKKGWVGESKSLRALQEATEAILEAVLLFLEQFQRPGPG